MATSFLKTNNKAYRIKINPKGYLEIIDIDGKSILYLKDSLRLESAGGTGCYKVTLDLFCITEEVE